MKQKFKIVLIMLAVFTLLTVIKAASAQTSSDTVLVVWQNPDGTPKVNALYDAVMGDTVTGGQRADLNRVYVLQAGGYYWNTETIQNNGWPLRIVGQTPGNTLQTGPAVFQIVARSDGSVAGHMMQPNGDLFMKNVYIIGADNNGVQTYYQPIEIEGNNLHVAFDSCIFERTNFALPAWNGKNNEIYFTNCKFRNLIGRPSTQQWEGRGISIWTDEDTVVVENCTFFNIEMTALQIEGGAAKYVRFNHNTIVNLGRSVTTGSWWREAYFTNNLLVNVFWHGEGFTDYSLTLNPGRDPRAYYSGMFGVGALPSTYGPDLGRRIAYSNMAAFLDPFFKRRYDDTVRVQPFTNAVTDSFLLTYSPTNGGQMIIQDTTWLNNYPSFGNNPDDSLQLQKMYQNITDLRAGRVPATPYFYSLPTDPQTGDTLWTSPSWPLPENFTYTDASLKTAGTDGLPLGDLNWFPSALNTFNANKAQYVFQIESIPGKKFYFNVDTLAEAESGIAGGTSVVKPVGGFVYYEFQSGGDIKWSFDVPTSGSVDSIVVLYNLNNQGQRGENIYLNGTNLQNNSGFGEYHFDNTNVPLATGFCNVVITAAQLVSGASAFSNVPAGQNTLEIKKSWGYDMFSTVTVYVHGNNPILLTIPNATLSGGIPHVTGSPWAPSGFKYDSLGSAGTITWTLNVPATSSYAINVAYQNVWGTAQVQVTVDGRSPITISLPANTDSTEQEILSSAFSLSQGSHTIVLSGSGANIDYIQLEEKVTGIRKPSDFAQRFTLSQNYPNPFNPSTEINYSIPERSLVTLTVYNVLGQKVVTLFSGYQNAGSYQVTFDASRYASGVYFYRLQAGNLTVTKKMMLIK
jgi:hypothetical protein